MKNAEITEKEPADRSRDKPPYQSRHRWVMLGLIWLAYFTFGLIVFSLAPLVTPILKDLDISYSQMGFIMGAWPLTYILVAIIGGAIVDRLGIRKSIFFGILVMGLSAGLRYFAGGFTAMFFCVALFGIGGPMISIGAPKTISQWFQGKERGMAVGLYMTGVWMGGAISISTMNSVIMPLVNHNWRNAFFGYSMMALVLACLWWLLARDVKTAETTKGERFDKVFRGLVSLRNVQLVLITGFLSFFIGHGISGWLPNILESSGLSPAVAGLAASIPTWVGVPTIVIVPRLTPPHLRWRLIAIFSVVVAAAPFVITQTTGGSLIAGLVFYGLANCCILPFLVLILMDLPEIETRYLGSAGGVFFCTAEIGAFTGPFVLGAIKDLTGGFLAGAILLCCLSLIRIAIALRVRARPASEITSP